MRKLQIDHVRDASRVEGLLFDKDGTLFDFRRSWAGWTAAVIADLGGADPAATDRIATALRFDLAKHCFHVDSPVIAGTPADIAGVLLPLLPGRSRGDLIAWLNASASEAPMVPAVPLRPLLERLRAGGYRLGLATNASEAEARAHLQGAGIADLFDYLAGFDSGHGPKPGAGMCLAFAEASGLAPERVAMIGDSLHDLHAGREAGMVAVGVLTGLADRAALAPHADAILPDIGALPGWLGDAGGAPET